MSDIKYIPQCGMELVSLSLKLFCISDAMSRAHQALMGVNANPRANAKTGAHVTQSMENAIVRGDGR